MPGHLRSCVGVVMKNWKLFNKLKEIIDAKKGGPWYQITNKADAPSRAEIYLYNDIGMWDISADEFVRELTILDVSEIDVRINSKGGEIFDGIAIYTALKSHKARVTTYVDSIAASIASVIAMAGDEIVMSRHSEMMIHKAQGITIGDDDDHEEAVNVLRRQNSKIAGIYAERAGGEVDHWLALMKAETWFTADEAVAAGLANRVGDKDAKKETNLVSTIFNFKHQGRSQAPAPDVVEEIEWVFDAEAFVNALREEKK